MRATFGRNVPRSRYPSAVPKDACTGFPCNREFVYHSVLTILACLGILAGNCASLFVGPDAGGCRPADMLRRPLAVSIPSYIIGPGDVLQVFVWRKPDLSVSMPVRPDGKVSTPLVEDILAVGKTPSAAGARHRKGPGRIRALAAGQRDRQSADQHVQPE